jgi:hypothetical protein
VIKNSIPVPKKRTFEEFDRFQQDVEAVIEELSKKRKIEENMNTFVDRLLSENESRHPAPVPAGV